MNELQKTKMNTAKTKMNKKQTNIENCSKITNNDIINKQT